jgi:hypothetical protein
MTDEQRQEIMRRQAESARAMSKEEMARRQLEAAQGMRNFYGGTADAQNNFVPNPPPPTLLVRFKRWLRA